MPIDYSSNVGKVRLRIGDVNDLPFLPDQVIQGAIDDNAGNLPAAAKLCANYILAQLAFKSHKKMAQMEIWGGEAFTQYRQFLMDTVSNPALASFTAVPHLISTIGQGPLEQLVSDWNKNWQSPTVSERMHIDAGYDELPGELG